MNPKTDVNQSDTSSLKSRVISAGAWTTLGHILSQFIRLAGNLILTRLLMPEMFGIMTIVFVIIIGLGLMSDFGLVPSIVQNRRGEEPRFLNVGWVVQIGRGILLCILTLLASWVLLVASESGWLPPGSAYSDPVLPEVMAIMAIIPLIQGFVSTKLHLASRKLMLGRATVIELISQITGLAVMIIWAWFDRTIWALVAGNIVINVVKVIMSHLIIAGPSNKFEWDKSIFYELLNFGKWIFLSSLIAFLLNQGDRLLLGGLVTAEVMGVYTIAFFLATAAYEILTKLNFAVFFPALSEVARERPGNLSSVYYKIRLRIDAITILLAGFLFETGHVIVDILYDDRYLDAGWMLQILSFSLIGIGFSTANQCFLAIGKVKVLSFLMAAQALTLFISLPVAFSLFGMIGAVWVVALIWTIQMIGSLWFMRKYELLKLHREFLLLPLFFVGIGVGLVAVWGVSNYLDI